MLGCKRMQRCSTVAVMLGITACLVVGAKMAAGMDCRIEESGAATSLVSNAGNTQDVVITRNAFVTLEPTTGKVDKQTFFVMIGFSKKHARGILECVPCSKEEYELIGWKVRKYMAFYFDDLGGISCITRQRTVFICDKTFAAQDIDSAWKAGLRTLTEVSELDWQLSSQVKEKRLTKIGLTALGHKIAKFMPSRWRSSTLKPSDGDPAFEEGNIKAMKREDERIVIVFSNRTNPEKKDELKVEVTTKGDLLGALLNDKRIPLLDETSAEGFPYDSDRD